MTEAEIKRLVKEARLSDKWLYCKFKNLWCSPAEMSRLPLSFSLEYWTLRDPQELITDIVEKMMQYEDELLVLRRNPTQNRTEIYLREGRILQRQEFILKLKNILDFRERKSGFKAIIQIPSKRTHE